MGIGKEIIMLESSNSEPVRFGFEVKGELKTIKVDRIVKKGQNNSTNTYICQSEIDGDVYTYELENEVNTGKWIITDIAEDGKH